MVGVTPDIFMAVMSSPSSSHTSSVCAAWRVSTQRAPSRRRARQAAVPPAAQQLPATRPVTRGREALREREARGLQRAAAAAAGKTGSRSCGPDSACSLPRAACPARCAPGAAVSGRGPRCACARDSREVERLRRAFGPGDVRLAHALCRGRLQLRRLRARARVRAAVSPGPVDERALRKTPCWASHWK
jgi:hypothetical protein